MFGGNPEDASEAEEATDGSGDRPERSVVVARHAGIVTLTAEPERLRDAERYLEAVTLSTQRQVLIDVQILEVDVGTISSSASTGRSPSTPSTPKACSLER